MALIQSFAALVLVAALGLVFAAAGLRLLRILRLEIENNLERLLCGAALGTIAFEVVVSALQYTQHVRVGVIAALALALIFAITEIGNVVRVIGGIARRIKAGPRFERRLAVVTGIVVAFESLMAMAPVTGSDALHYHFTTPLLELSDGFRPDFSLVHGFFVGQSHQLILTGLALGSDRLSMGLIFLGGMLAAAATICLARKWVSREWAWVCGLVFLLTPVAFWQISAAGAPDVWMAFFAALSVLVVARTRNQNVWQLGILAGAMAGAIAGAKYTGCLLAASIAVAYLWETRSAKRVSVFFGAALCAGIWPYARNFAWTDDPMFPFLLQRFAPERVHAFTLASVLADTGASAHRSLLQIAEFPLMAAVDPLHPGFWQFFGPLCLVFAPLVIMVVRKTPLWRAALIVWLASGVLIGLSSGMTRFLLPILPIALAAAFAGVAELDRLSWRFARVLARITIVSFLLLGAAALFVYGRAAVSASTGIVGRDAYLRAHAPDYEETQFLNEVLRSATSTEQGTGGRALVFFHHLYYLRVPFVYGDPAGSWSVDPALLNTPQAWQEFFHRENIRWVVRAPEYPKALEASLEELERAQVLYPVASGEVDDFDGMRFLGVRKKQSITIFRVKE